MFKPFIVYSGTIYLAIVCWVVGTSTLCCTKTDFPLSDIRRAYESTVRVVTDQSMGSGVIIGNDDGIIKILTCNHVIMDVMSETPANNITIEVFRDDVVIKTMSAHLLKNDIFLDIALLVVYDPDANNIAISNLIPKNKIKDLKLTDDVYGIGCPMGQNPMVQHGILGRFSAEDHYWRSSSPVFPGFSGGPLFVFIDDQFYVVGLHAMVDIHYGQFANDISWIINPHAIYNFMETSFVISND